LKKCYLLGAGASYGYDDNLPDLGRPPLSNEFFSKGQRLGLFTEDKYPRLYQALIEYTKLQKIENPDIENFLSWLATNFYKSGEVIHEVKTDVNFERAIFLQCALGESFYFIYDILKYYSLSYKPDFDCYRRLALHYFDKKYNIVTLNYDTLFENAILSLNGSFYYLPPRRHPNSIPIAKLHGSINWLNPFGKAIAHRNLTGKDAFRTVVCSVFSNRAWMEDMKILHPLALKEIEVDDLVRSGTDYDEPALIPPLEDYKDYEKVERYKEVWDFAKSMLRDTTELILIGCSLRRQDKKLEELLSKSIRRSVSFTIVSPDYKNVRERLEEMLQTADVKECFSSFRDYVGTL